MTTRKLTAALLVLAGCSAWTLGAQDAPAGRGGRGGGRGAAPTEGPGSGTDVTATRNFDKAAVARGAEQFGNLCASCHGTDARGGAGKTDVDLVRSVVVLDDLAGKRLDRWLGQHPDVVVSKTGNAGFIMRPDHNS